LKLTTAICKSSGGIDPESRSDLQGHELLEQELARIWNAYLADVL